MPAFKQSELKQYAEQLIEITKVASTDHANIMALNKEVTGYKTALRTEKNRSKLEEISQNCSKRPDEIIEIRANIAKRESKLAAIILPKISAPVETKAKDKNESELVNSIANAIKGIITEVTIREMQKLKDLCGILIAEQTKILSLLEQAFEKFEGQANEKLGKPKVTVSDKGKFAPSKAPAPSEAPAETKKSSSPSASPSRDDAAG